MSATESAQPPASNATHAAATVPPSSSVGRRRRISLGRLLALAAAVTLVAVAFVPVMSWIEYRRNHSITDDVFVEAHIVNVAPQLVSGRLMRYHVDENDQVVQGQVVAEIDPIPYQDKVNIARAQLESAEAELARQRADVDRVRKEVPIQIEIARRTFAAAEADQAKAEEALKLTRDEVEKGIDEARAGLKAAQASLKLAEIEYARFTRLEQQGASTLQRQQQMTQSRDSALAQVDLNQARLAKAVASLTQIDVARRTLESAQKSALKASTGINLAEVGHDQIRELELLVKVKERGVEQATTCVGSRRERPRVYENPSAVSRNRGETLPAPGRLLAGRLASVEHVQSGSPLHGGQPGGGSLAGGRTW